jgi:hypothetical protein
MAMARHFGRDLRFAEAFGDGMHQKELQQLHDLIEQIALERVKNEVACLPGPGPALADAAEDRTSTAATRAGLAALLVLAVPMIPLMLFSALIFASPN